MKFSEFWDNIQGPKRIIVLKPRQAGFSTLVAGKLFHKMITQEHFKGIAMADKHARTQEIGKIYSTFLFGLEDAMRPMVAKDNSEEILFDNPKQLGTGLGSGLSFETANDPNAGRSGTRRFAHLSETAFYRYHKEIDEGIQNSIPLDASTCIIKESTANGKAGIGKAFYDLYMAAKHGDSIYKSFFVAWYEIDDYQIEPIGFKPDEYEEMLLAKYPLTEANLMWRRLKIKEYLSDDEQTILTPDERFKQDFPIDDNEAFLSTGAPVFPQEILDHHINKLSGHKPSNLFSTLNLDIGIIGRLKHSLEIFSAPRQGKFYVIGADIAEGLAIGDSSSLCVLDENGTQVAKWHGKCDPDVFGHFLMALGELYNNALLVPEVNNMGITTVLTIKNEGYPRLFRQIVDDKTGTDFTEKLGWRTTKKSKQEMLNEAIIAIRDNTVNIRDKNLLIELQTISRGENGEVVLNGKDRTVALCLALMGLKYHRPVAKPAKPRAITGTGEEITKAWKKSRNKGDIFG